MKIGFFDSGVGGLALMHAARTVLPAYDYVFYGDTAHVPYGDRSEAEIYMLTQDAVGVLFEKGCGLVVLACNTASAETLRRLQDTYLLERYSDRRILGVIIPTIEEVIVRGARRALLIATARTVASGKYERELSARNITESSITSVATPELVPLIERGDIDGAIAHATRAILAAERKQGGEVFDTLILGCTHYVMLKHGLRDAHHGRLSIVSQDEVIPRKLAHYLLRHPEIETHLSRGGSSEEFFSGPFEAAVVDRIKRYGSMGR